jgi:hypothetical protein
LQATICTSVDTSVARKFSLGSLGVNGVIFTRDTGNRFHEHVQAILGLLLALSGVQVGGLGVQVASFVAAQVVVVAGQLLAANIDLLRRSPI